MTNNFARNVLKLIALYSIILLPHGSAGIAQDAAARLQTLRSELAEMLKDDQKYRGMVNEIENDKTLPADEKEKKVSALWERQNQLDQTNIRKLAKIIDLYGWPTRSGVGKEGSLAAFLVVQHGDLNYQKKYFPLIKDAVSKGEADRDDAALLEDRILMRDGKKQIYGTQLYFNEATKKLELWPIENEESVDARRASVGLRPLAEYVKSFGLEYKRPK